MMEKRRRKVKGRREVGKERREDREGRREVCMDGGSEGSREEEEREGTSEERGARGVGGGGR